MEAGQRMIAILFAAWAAAGTAPGALSIADGPTAERIGNRIQVSFTVNEETDVEVAIVDRNGDVVRHLAAGVRGGKTPPPPPFKPGLAQSLTWGGKDDYGVSLLVPESPERQGVPLRGAARLLSRRSLLLGKADPAPGGPFSVRIRAGMGVKLEQIVGGDPYAYHSRQMAQGDHAGWHIAGLEAKSDGTVYVLGNANIYGPPALRAYDADGNYLRTVFPPPAGKPVEAMKGWGLNVHPDGSWSPQFQTTDSPAITRTILMGDGRAGGVPGLHPVLETGTLVLRRNFSGMEIGTDGTCTSRALKPLVSLPQPKDGKPKRFDHWLNGSCYVCPEPDGRGFYLSGMFAGEWKGGKLYKAAKEGFWRDGQVWFVDGKTGEPSVFYGIKAEEVGTYLKSRGASPIGGSKHNPYGAFQGVTVDREGRVFVCDRLHKQVVVLDKDATVLRTIPVDKPDAVAAHPTGKALYVTTRRGTYHKRGELKLVRFNDWSKDSEPSQTIRLCPAGVYKHQSFLAVAFKGSKVSVWVAYTQLPVKVYRETGSELTLLKDFYESGSKQRCLDMQRIAVDPKTETVYAATGFENLFRLRDWGKPHFQRCYQKEGVRVRASSVAIDARRRQLFGQHKARGPGWAGPVERFSMDGPMLTPVGIGPKGDNRVTGDVHCPHWMIVWGNGDRGIAVAPDGNLATLDGPWGKAYGLGVLRWFRRNEESAPWPETKLGVSGAFGGIRFDLAGNLYLGAGASRKKFRGEVAGHTDFTPPFDKDKTYRRGTGRIVKYTPTGSLASGDLYPKVLEEPVKVYDVHYGPFGFRFNRTPRFGIDGWGRIYYPNGLAQRVGVIDNEGNEIVRFGNYGNRDSVGGLDEEPVPTKGIPMGCPNSVDATDDYIYVGDTVNIRLLRVRKTFAATWSVQIR